MKEKQQTIDFVVAVKKVRVMCFDSLMQSDSSSKTSKSKVQNEILQRTLQDFEADQVQFKPHSVIITECSF